MLLLRDLLITNWHTLALESSLFAVSRQSGWCKDFARWCGHIASVSYHNNIDSSASCSLRSITFSLDRWVLHCICFYTGDASIVSDPFLFACRLAISLAARFCVVLFYFPCQCSACRCRCSIIPILFCLLKMSAEYSIIIWCDFCPVVSLPGVSFGLSLLFTKHTVGLPFIYACLLLSTFGRDVDRFSSFNCF
jgi:hypothetical protein